MDDQVRQKYALRGSIEISMVKFDGIIGKALLTVTEKENELTLVFADNRFLFVTLEGGKMKSVSVPE